MPSMKACLLHSPAPIETKPLDFADVPAPEPAANEFSFASPPAPCAAPICTLLKANCHSRKSPDFEGHQISSRDRKARREARAFGSAHRVGIAWRHSTCGVCGFAVRRRNLEPLPSPATP